MDAMELAKLTAQVVEAFASGNRLSAAEVPTLIASVHQSLSSAGAPAQVAPAEVEKLTPARIRQSIKPDHLISFEDGRAHKILTRHLTGLGLTAAQYRSKWGLPSDYPMTAASYSEKRSALAKAAGFGRTSAKLAPPGSPPPSAGPGNVSQPAPKPNQTRKPRAATETSAAE